MTLSFGVAASLEDFSEAARQELANGLSDLLSCYVPNCQFYLAVTAASIRVVATLVIPNTQTLAGAQAAYNNIALRVGNLTALPPEALSSALGVNVSAAVTVAVEYNSTTTIAVAPPPPPGVPSTKDSSATASASPLILAIVLSAVVLVTLVVASCLFRRHFKRLDANKRADNQIDDKIEIPIDAPTKPRTRPPPPPRPRLLNQGSPEQKPQSSSLHPSALTFSVQDTPGPPACVLSVEPISKVSEQHSRLGALPMRRIHHADLLGDVELGPPPAESELAAKVAILEAQLAEALAQLAAKAPPETTGIELSPPPPPPPEPAPPFRTDEGGNEHALSPPPPPPEPAPPFRTDEGGNQLALSPPPPPPEPYEEIELGPLPPPMHTEGMELSPAPPPTPTEPQRLLPLDLVTPREFFVLNGSPRPHRRSSPSPEQPSHGDPPPPSSNVPSPQQHPDDSASLRHSAGASPRNSIDASPQGSNGALPRHSISSSPRELFRERGKVRRAGQGGWSPRDQVTLGGRSQREQVVLGGRASLPHYSNPPVISSQAALSNHSTDPMGAFTVGRSQLDPKGASSADVLYRRRYVPTLKPAATESAKCYHARGIDIDLRVLKIPLQSAVDPRVARLPLAAEAAPTPASPRAKQRFKVTLSPRPRNAVGAQSPPTPATASGTLQRGERSPTRSAKLAHLRAYNERFRGAPTSERPPLQTPMARSPRAVEPPQEPPLVLLGGARAPPNPLFPTLNIEVPSFLSRWQREADEGTSSTSLVLSEAYEEQHVEMDGELQHL